MSDRARSCSRLRVLLIAEAANPELVSVPLVGWMLARHLAQLSSVHLVTQIRNRDAITRSGLIEGKDFTAIDSEAVARLTFRLRKVISRDESRAWTMATALSTLAYYYFEWLVWSRFKEAITSGAFDIVHRVTPLSPTTPSYLARRCADAGVPFVLGPLNGGVAWPKHFGTALRNEREWLSYVRGLYKLLPGYRATREHAAAVLIGSRDTWMQMDARYRAKCFYVPENAINLNEMAATRTRVASRPIRVAYLGRFVPYKGADMLIEAAAPFIRSGGLELTLFGDGPQRPELRRLVRRHGVEHGVTFGGWVPHANVSERLAGCDVFAFPSIREFGGAVILEAMAVGLPPIVVAYGGPAELVTPQTGFLLRPGTRAEIVQQLRDLLGTVVTNPEQIDVRSEPARRRAREQFSWGAKATQITTVYQWLMGRRTKPDFPMPIPDLSDPLSVTDPIATLRASAFGA